MSRLAGLQRRLQRLQNQQCRALVVSLYVEGPECQHWLCLRDGRQFHGKDALRLLPNVTWGQGGITYVVGIDLDVMSGIQPEPEGMLECTEEMAILTTEDSGDFTS